MTEDVLEIYFDGLGRGGAEQLLVELLPELTQHFARVEVLALQGAHDLEPAVAALVPVTWLTRLGMARRLWRSEAVCHVNLARPQMLASVVAIARWLLRRPSRRIVCHEHASFHYHLGRGGLRGIVDAVFRRLVLFCLRRRLYRYVISTRARRRELAADDVAVDTMLVLPNSVGRERMARLAACRDRVALATSFAAKTYRMFTLSRLHSVKQLDWAIDAAEQLAEVHADWTFELAVCGTGPEQESLRRHAEAVATADNVMVSFPGFVDSFETPAAGSHCFLFPSRSEGFPVGLTEAALTGVTAVSTDCPHGPADLAEFFPNIHLASPPTHERFLAVVRDVVGREIARPDYVDGAAKTDWPTSEDVARTLADFLHDGADG